MACGGGACGTRPEGPLSAALSTTYPISDQVVLAKAIEQQALSRALAAIQFQLNGFGTKIGKSNAAKLEADLRLYLSGIDVGGTVTSCRDLFDGIVSRNDYADTLRFYNCKGIVAFVATAFGVDKDVYVQVVLGRIKGEPQGTLATAMRKAIER